MCRQRTGACSPVGLCSSCGEIRATRVSCVKGVSNAEGRLTFVAKLAATHSRLYPNNPTSSICSNGSTDQCSGGVDGDGSFGPMHV